MGETVGRRAGGAKGGAGGAAPHFQEAARPSHLNTQVKDPGYKRINGLISQLTYQLNHHNVAERMTDFNVKMRAFLMHAGCDLVKRMLETKVLCQLILQDMQSTRRVVEALRVPKEDRDWYLHQLSVFEDAMPRGAADKEGKEAKLHMHALVAYEKGLYEAERARDREEKRANGVEFVKWSSDEEDV